MCMIFVNFTALSQFALERRSGSCRAAIRAPYVGSSWICPTLGSIVSIPSTSGACASGRRSRRRARIAAPNWTFEEDYKYFFTFYFNIVILLQCDIIILLVGIYFHV